MFGVQMKITNESLVWIILNTYHTLPVLQSCPHFCPHTSILYYHFCRQLCIDGGGRIHLHHRMECKSQVVAGTLLSTVWMAFCAIFVSTAVL